VKPPIKKSVTPSDRRGPGDYVAFTELVGEGFASVAPSKAMIADVEDRVGIRVFKHARILFSDIGCDEGEKG
jgi:hypothetical protein